MVSSCNWSQQKRVVVESFSLSLSFSCLSKVGCAAKKDWFTQSARTSPVYNGKVYGKSYLVHNQHTCSILISPKNFLFWVKLPKPFKIKYCTSLGKSSIIRKTLLNANPPFTYVYLQNLPNIYLSIYLIQFVQSLTPKSRTFINKHWIKLSEQNIHIKTSHIICGNIFDISTHRCSKTVEEIAKSPIPHLQ